MSGSGSRDLLRPYISLSAKGSKIIFFLFSPTGTSDAQKRLYFDKVVSVFLDMELSALKLLSIPRDPFSAPSG